MMKKLLLSLSVAFSLTAAAPYSQAETSVAEYAAKISIYNKVPDFDKIQYWVGEGENSAAIIFQWNNPNTQGPENLVYGYRWSGEDTTLSAALEAITGDDSRFVNFQVSDNGITQIGFDGNNNGYIDGSGYDSDFSANTGWHIGYYDRESGLYPASNDSYSGLPLKNNDIAIAFYNYTSAFVKEFGAFVPYLFYRPARNCPAGAYQPEEFNYFYDTASRVCVPVFIQFESPEDFILSAISPLNFGIEINEDSPLESLVPDERENMAFVIYDAGKKIDRKITGTATYKTMHSCFFYTYDNNGSVIDKGEKKIWTNETKVTFYPPLIEYETVTFPKEVVETYPSMRVINSPKKLPSYATFTRTLSENDNPAMFKTFLNSGSPTLSSIPGEVTITERYGWKYDKAASYRIISRVKIPVTEILVDDELHIPYKGLLTIDPQVLPENAEIKTVSISIEDTDIVTYYSSTKDLIAQKAGTTNVTFSANDGSGVSKTVKVIVDEPQTYSGNFDDGLFIINEEWYSHRNGSVNYITADRDVFYRAYDSMNDGATFGATSCSGIIFAGKLFVVSKQDKDPGDKTTGSRLAVIDAKTMKKLADYTSFPSSGDGRGCVGVNENKVYIASTAAVNIYNPSTLEFDGTVSVTGTVGDMVCNGKYVFAVIQNSGVAVINTLTDKTVKVISITNPHGIAQTPDGYIWVASSNSFHCIDPESLEVVRSVELPDGLAVNCTWGAWRPTSFCASATGNILYWANMSGAIAATTQYYYRWDTSTDILTAAEPFVTLNDEIGGWAYGTVRVDSRTDELVAMSQTGPIGTSARYVWVNFFNATTGELNKSVRLNDYYWFQALSVFPDKYEPEISLESIEASLDESVVIDLSGYLTDRDANQPDCNIVPEVVSAADAAIADVVLDNKILTVTGKAIGKTSFSLKAMSNGIVTEREIPISVSDNSGIGNVTASNVRIVSGNGKITVHGLESGEAATVFNTSGLCVASKHSCGSMLEINLPAGFYIVRAGNAKSVKVAVKQ